MAKKIGVCKNIDCDHYNEHIEVETGAEMECPYCHQPLKLLGNGSTNTPSSKKKYIVGAAILVLALGGGAIALMPSGDKEKAQVPEATAVDPAQPATAPETSVEESKPEVESESQPEVKKEAEASALVTGRGTITLSYGSYTGDLKNGKPHGYGVITYSKSQKIVPSKDFVANPGDKFEGDFRDGKISGLGYWIHDGNKTVVKP